jgi:outer membrane protein assembly factor BamB
LIAQGATWPRPAVTPDWPTFAGAPTREKIAPRPVDAGGVAWRLRLPKDGLEPPAAGIFVLGPKRPDAADTLSYYPLLVGDRIFVNDQREIWAVRAADGRPAWGDTSPVIFREAMEGVVGDASLPSDTLGLPRFTMTAFDNRLFARMGSPVTSRSQQPSSATGSSYLVCLDLQAEGKLLWKTTAEEGWAFEGAPLADAEGVYVAMRRQDIRPQAHVACFNPQTGRLRWRRFICGAETPARGILHQCTHNLLTLRGDTLYYNTNLGAVAALSTGQGRLRWVSLYPRARHGDLLQPAHHWQRDLTPCLYYSGTLLVAPADSPQVFALDAGTGQVLWQTELGEVAQLLGVAGDCLIASGRRLYWIGLADQRRGRLVHVWPDSQARPGFGRGVLADGYVLWPTRDKIYFFDEQTAVPKKVIDLASLGAGGGNLLSAQRRLLIANGSELIALGRPAKPMETKPAELTVTAVSQSTTSPASNPDH